MKQFITNALQVKRGVQTTQTMVVNPLSFAFDRILGILVTTFVPFPVVRELLIAFKKPLLGMLASLVLTIVVCVFMGLSIILTPLGVLSQLSLPALFQGTGALSEAELQALAGYFESVVASPFGDSGNFITTASFHDPGYFARFHLTHEGIDLIPSDRYYQTNEAYNTLGQVVVFSTMSGTALSYTDSYGALTVDIVNQEGTIKTVYKHLKQIIMQNGEVSAGQAVGVMGNTGFSFGEHLHYEVRVNQGGSWIAVNPASYIN